ncbi:MAG: zinc ABC transporter substrate-binding protein [Candidatus Magasanikbacteria bacterium]|nr:zinc ABC transporter substrate-binding protein [Candidatus Magasanikbacteria bacterium]
MKNKLFIVFLAVLFIFIVVTRFSFFSKIKNTAQSKTTITTSFYPLYFFTQKIVGDTADVINITPSAAEPHDYEPTAQDIARMHDSDILVLNGGKFESWGEDIVANLSGSDTEVVFVSDKLMSNKFVDESGDTIPDPHVWLDPVLAKEQVKIISEALKTKDPANADLYTKNTDELLLSLDQIDQAYHNGFNNCKQKTFVTSHSAFGYLASRYGITQLSISGLSPDSEPSPKNLSDVTAFVKKHRIPVIFFENLVSPKLSETIAKEVGVKTLVLNPIEGLTKEEISQGKNYFTEMNSNLNNLKIALQCQ